MRSDDDGDDAKFEKLIFGLLHHSGKVTEAAASVGVSKATAYRWMRHPRFVTLYREARRTALGAAMAGLELGAAAAVHALERGFADPAATQVSITSARWFVTLAIKVHELETVHEELETLRDNFDQMRAEVYGKKTPAAEAAASVERTTMSLNDDQVQSVSLRSLWMNLVGHDQSDIAASLKFNRPQSVAEEQYNLDLVKKLLKAEKRETTPADED